MLYYKELSDNAVIKFLLLILFFFNVDRVPQALHF